MATRKKAKTDDQSVPTYGRNMERPKASEADRKIAIARLFEIVESGNYRSDGPHLSRDELYDEMFAEPSRCS